MEEIEIRPAIESDSAELHGMLTRLAEETGDIDHFCGSVDVIRKHGFGPRRLFHCLVAVRRQQSLGMALYFPIYSTTRGQPGVYLQDLWVATKCRDTGLGTRILRRVVMSASRQWDARYLDLMVHGHNEGADRFYRRHGFIERTQDRHLSLEYDGFSRLCDSHEHDTAED